VSPTDAACAFVQIVAQAEPDAANNLERQVVNAARRITRRLHAEGIIHPGLPPPRAPESASGIPITRSKS
jgi:hypothetical protein